MSLALEGRFLAILDQSPLSIQVLSADGFTLQVNRAWEELWGLTLEQIEGYNILEDEQLVKNGIMPFIKKAFAGEPAEIPPVFYDPNETLPDLTRHAEPQRWTKGVIYPIKNAAGEVLEVVLMHEDITAQIQTEEKIKASESRYRSLFETTLDGIMVVDEGGQYIDVNESMCRILKTPREKLIGSHFAEYMLSDRIEDAQRIFTDLQESGIYRGYFPMRAADGSIVELEWSSRANFTPGLHVCVARDVTERRRHAEALRLSESRHQRAAESGGVGVWELDLETEELYLSANLKTMLGYKEDEIPNSQAAFFELIHPEDRDIAAAASRSYLDGKAPRFEIEIRRRHKDGHYLWFLGQGVAARDAQGKAIKLTGSDTDITARKQIEHALIQSEERYRSLLDNANDIIYSHDLNGRYLAINRAGENITGYTREEILGGLNIAQVVAPDHLELAKRMVEQKLKNPAPTVYEIDIIAKDGRRLTLEVSTRIFYQNGSPAAVEGVARDVTDRKQAEKEKTRLAEQIEDQRRHLQEMVSSVPGVVWEAWGEPDAANQRMDFVSDYVETMLGYTVDEWISTPNFWLTIVHPDDQERAAQTAAETFASGTRGTNQFRWMAKDGRIIWVESQSVAIFNEAGKPVGMRGVTMDISERKQKQINERFLAEASTALASTLDYQTTLGTVARLAVPHFSDWCAVDVAGEDERLHRLAVAHVDPEKVDWAHEIYLRYPPSPDDEQGLYNVLRTGEPEFYPEIPDELLVNGARDEGHLEIMRRVGFRSCMLVPLKVRERTLGVITFVNTEQSRQYTLEDLALAEDLANRAALAVDNALLYRSEQQTRRATERTSNLLKRLQSVSTSLSQALTPQQVAGAVVIQGLNSVGAHAGTVVLLNEAGTELEIVDTVNFPDDIVKKWQRFPLSQQVPIADAIRGKAPVIVESFEEWKDCYPGLGPLASVTGSQALVAFPLIVEGRTIGAMGLSFPKPQKFSEDDYAFMLALAHQCAQALERARLYETEQMLRTQAEAANRMKDEFLATVSHELRTPLNAIVGWSSILTTNKFDEEVTTRAIQTIERNAKAQAQIIEDLLDVSRIITGKLNLNLKRTELASIVKTALETLQPSAAAKNIRIESRFDSEAGTALVMGDPDRLQQVMWNLLSNAVKFTPQDGEIEVTLGRAGESLAQIVVRDTGQGISPEFLPLVFERFSQADGTSTRKYGGLGLGLAIVHHLIEMHGGTIKVESEGTDKGTVFTVNLPLAATPAAAAPPPAQKGGGLTTENSAAENRDSLAARFPGLQDLRVLVVDDEPDTRELLTTIIESCGAQVLAADSAGAAFKTIGKFKPHLLVSDIAMPGEDGYSLIRRLRNLGSEKGGSIPAISLTAYAREEDRQKALAAGFQMHLAKPIDPEDLLAAVRELIGDAGDAREK